MQQGRAPVTSEPRGKEVDKESQSSISTSSSLAGIPPDSPEDEGHYRDDEPLTYETVEYFSGATELYPRRGYVRHDEGPRHGVVAAWALLDKEWGKVLVVIMGVI
ncbi:hypothetical protein AAC387_Pa09g1202 [Persea americana]